MQTLGHSLEVLTSNERSMLRHALSVAAMKFGENARNLANAKPSAFINERGITDMRELFTDYERQTAALLEQIDGADGVAFLHNEEE
jgi:hypothetical protein